jgi:transcriptional regulator with XRE-family HTH domain
MIVIRADTRFNCIENTPATRIRTTMAPAPKPTLGSLIRGLRTRHGLTLKQMADRTGVPFSTLSKVEHDRLTLTYDKLQMISERLNVRMSELFAEPESTMQAVANSRRSVATLANALYITTQNYDYYYLSPELRRKEMIPIVSRIKARSLAEFGEMVRHDGQEFLYVVEGTIVVHTEFYDTVTIGKGESVYIDSRMGHAYVLADGCEDAVALCVCSTTQEELLDNAARQGRPLVGDSEEARPAFLKKSGTHPPRSKKLLPPRLAGSSGTKP